MHRIAFDPALPVVAASPFMAAGRSFVSGEAVDWRALGVSEQILFDWWRAGQVSFLPAPAVQAAEVVTDEDLERLTRPEPKRKRK